MRMMINNSGQSSMRLIRPTRNRYTSHTTKHFGFAQYKPAQVITYKYGANRILEWRLRSKVKTPENIKEFHRKILKNGSIPFSVLNKVMFEEIN